MGSLERRGEIASPFHLSPSAALSGAYWWKSELQELSSDKL